jgi:hypothetical protein
VLDDYDFFAKLALVRPDAPQNFDDTVRQYFIYNAELLLQKHRDYGPRNIADAPGGAINGLRVRMHDKMARINHLIDSKQSAVNEPLRDSFIDLANYAMIGLLVVDGKWPSK